MHRTSSAKVPHSLSGGAVDLRPTLDSPLRSRTNEVSPCSSFMLMLALPALRDPREKHETGGKQIEGRQTPRSSKMKLEDKDTFLEPERF